MRKSLLQAGLVAIVIIALAGCNNYNQVSFHNKKGRVRTGHLRKSQPWFRSGEKGYSKPARRTINAWDRQFR